VIKNEAENTLKYNINEKVGNLSGVKPNDRAVK